MGIEEIYALLEAKSFEPFTLTMSDRSSYDIDRPERLRIAPRGRALYIERADGLKTILAVEHVVSITFLEKPIIRDGR
jgi:hypothetical protein